MPDRKGIKKPVDPKTYRLSTHMKNMAVGGGVEPPRSS